VSIALTTRPSRQVALPGARQSWRAGATRQPPAAPTRARFASVLWQVDPICQIRPQQNAPMAERAHGRRDASAILARTNRLTVPGDKALAALASLRSTASLGPQSP
jgi:hypothetical protein